jgi:hypothetical protein
MRFTLTSLARYLFFITAVILFFLGLGSFMRIDPNPAMKTIYAVYGILMLGDALAMAICGLNINRKIKAGFWLAVIVLSLNIVLTIFDQFGLIDFLFAVLNVITLILLLVVRKELLPQ